MAINLEEAQNLYYNAVEQGLIKGGKAAIIYVKSKLDEQLDLLDSKFPESVFHAVAIKTQAHPAVMEHIVQHGFGLEAASMGEVKLAKAAGAPNKKIVFDSPVKTEEEIRSCHTNYPGMILNANSLEELTRYPRSFSGKIGLRINPLQKSNAPESLNLSGLTSKFGVPINRYKEILDACITHKQISGLHLHIGSRISDFSSNVEAIRKIKSLADEVNSLRRHHRLTERIEFIDIGGGIDFSLYRNKSSLEEFVRQLKTIHGLFENYKVITEYGNFVHKENSFVISNIEYLIPNANSEPTLVFIHVGADLFVRKVYSSIPIEYPVHAIHMNKQSGLRMENYRIVGPLCFEGDILFDKVRLPELKQGDKILIMNAGANTNSMWSRHCNREEPEFLFI